jgi:hypothetical protein
MYDVQLKSAAIRHALGLFINEFNVYALHKE